MDAPTLSLAPATRRLTALVDSVDDSQLGAPTPCRKYTVGDLLDHLASLSVGFAAAAAKTDVSKIADDGPPPSAPGTCSAANLPRDWRRLLSRRLDTLAAAWDDPSAWTGDSEIGDVALPADVMGIVVVNELVVHGWDLARAVDAPFDAAPDHLDALAAMLSQGGGDDADDTLFGPPVSVAVDAAMLDQVLGMTGRDPAWTP